MGIDEVGKCTMKMNYILTVQNDETGERVANLEAYSLDSLQEQMHKIEKTIKDYQDENNRYEYEESEFCQHHMERSECIQCALVKIHI